MKYLLTVVLLSLSLLSYSQRTEDVNPFRVGVKVGFPNGVGLGVEYVTPILGNRIAPFLDYSMLPIEDLDFKYFEVGSNIYISRRGKGGYVALSYGDLNGKVENLSGTNDADERYTNGVVKEQLSTFNLKLGWKYGRKLYFRVEGGYAFGKLPRSVEVTADVNGNRESFYLNYEEVFDYISGNGYPVFNLGIGYGF